jgi:hypothetical protein
LSAASAFVIFEPVVGFEAAEGVEAVVGFEVTEEFDDVVVGFEVTEEFDDVVVGFEAAGEFESVGVAGEVEVPGEFESVGVLLQPAKTVVEHRASRNIRMSPLILLGLRDFLFRRFAVF